MPLSNEPMGLGRKRVRPCLQHSSADALETLGPTDYRTQLALVAFETGATDSSVFELGLNTLISFFANRAALLSTRPWPGNVPPWAGVV